MRIFFLKGQPLIEIDYSHDGEQKDEKKGLDILHKVSKHTLPFIFRYFAIYVDILF